MNKRKLLMDFIKWKAECFAIYPDMIDQSERALVNQFLSDKLKAIPNACHKCHNVISNDDIQIEQVDSKVFVNAICDSCKISRWQAETTIEDYNQSNFKGKKLSLVWQKI